MLKLKLKLDAREKKALWVLDKDHSNFSMLNFMIFGSKTLESPKSRASGQGVNVICGMMSDNWIVQASLMCLLRPTSGST